MVPTLFREGGERFLYSFLYFPFFQRMPSSTSLTIALAGGLLLSVGYLAYFDYKRRDPNFRKRLRQERKLAREEYEEKVTRIRLLTAVFKTSGKACCPRYAVRCW